MRLPASTPRGVATPRAFTLIEAIAAITILALAIPAVFWGMRDAGFRRIDPIMASRARWLASEKLEEVVADRHAPSRGYSYIVGANYPGESSIASFPGFTRSVAITESGADLVSGSGTGFKTITVSVAYTDSRAVARTVAISSVVTEYTP